jgi:hypothetical protein
VADNRSLDEFVGVEEAVEPEPAADPESGGSEPSEGDGGTAVVRQPGDADDAVEPMAETFAWSATGGECATCGGAVEERWRDGDALVCGDCKAW